MFSSAVRRVEPERKGIAGMMAAFALILGVFCGIVFTFPLTFFIEHAGSYVRNTTTLAFDPVSSATSPTSFAVNTTTLF